MKCTACLATMRCISEIHDVPNQLGRKRMDLHCTNRLVKCTVPCHMGVITENSNLWVCHDYTFCFIYEEGRYYLHGHDFSVDYYHQGMRVPKTTLMNKGRLLIDIPQFIPISTGDDMHERAWDLFHRLRKLVIYS